MKTFLKLNIIFSLLIAALFGLSSNAKAQCNFYNVNPNMPQTVCQNDEIVITLSGSDPTVIYDLKFNGIVVNSKTGDANGDQITFDAYQITTTGTFSVEARCGQIMNGQPLYTVNPAPANCNVTGGPNFQYCSGAWNDNIEVDNTEPSCNYKTYWSYNNQLTYEHTVQGNGGTIYIPCNGAVGVQKVLAVNQNTGCTKWMSSTVTINPSGPPFNNGPESPTYVYCTNCTANVYFSAPLNGCISDTSGIFYIFWWVPTENGYAGHCSDKQLYSKTNYDIPLGDTAGTWYYAIATQRGWEKNSPIGYPVFLWQSTGGSFEVTVPRIGSSEFINSENSELSVQNNPNPSSQQTIINYIIPEDGLVTIELYSMPGAKIANIAATESKAGTYKINFNTANLADGIYNLVIRSGTQTAMSKMVIIH